MRASKAIESLIKEYVQVQLKLMNPNLETYRLKGLFKIYRCEQRVHFSCQIVTELIQQI